MSDKLATPYDAQELELLEAIERDEWIASALSASEKETYAQSAAYTMALNEKRQTTIRFSVADLAIIKAKAKELGIGYQNLIQLLVHQYATGKVSVTL